MKHFNLNGKEYFLDDLGKVIFSGTLPRRRRIDPQLYLKELALVHKLNYEAALREGMAEDAALRTGWFSAKNRLRGDFTMGHGGYRMPKRALDKIRAALDALGGAY